MEQPGLSGALKFFVAPSYEAMSARAAKIILDELERRPALVLCASAGETPARLYEILAASARNKPKLFSKLRVLQIDEWAGLPRAHPATCAADLRQKFISPAGLKPRQFVAFRTEELDTQRECSRIARWLRLNGPIDICILGLGGNGHIAMNEPAEMLQPNVHASRLAPSSREHPMLARLSRKPTHGLTLGMGNLLHTRKVLLLVSGAHKRAALKKLLKPGVSSRFPASFLWLHPDAAVLCDARAWPARRHTPSPTRRARANR